MSRKGQGQQPDDAFLAQIWAEAEMLHNSPNYQALLGEPTRRERMVAAWQGMRAPRGRPLFATAMAAAAVLALAVAGAPMLMRALAPDYRTDTAEIRDIRLEDGSTVTLGARTTMDVAFTDSARLVTLSGGEAFFAVAKDPKRPFLISAGKSVVRVLGTKFNVKYDGAQLRVAVLEGVVQVSLPKPKEPVTLPARRLIAGQQLVAPAVEAAAARPAAVTVEPVKGAEPGAWRSGRHVYQDATLAEIISDANRYFDGRIHIQSPELAGMRLTTSFRAGQVEQMLGTLPDALPLSVERNADGDILLRARSRQADG